MPEYPYVCRDCGHAFSVRKSISAAKSPECCPQCGGETKRTWTAPAISTGSSAGGSYAAPPSTCAPSG